MSYQDLILNELFSIIDVIINGFCYESGIRE